MSESGMVLEHQTERIENDVQSRLVIPDSKAGQRGKLKFVRLELVTM